MNHSSSERSQVSTEIIDLEFDYSNKAYQNFIKKHPKNFKQLQFSQNALQSKRLLSKLKASKQLRSLSYVKSTKKNDKFILNTFKSQRFSLKQFSGLSNSLLKHFPNISILDLGIQDESGLLGFKYLPHLHTLSLNIANDLPVEDCEDVKILYYRFWHHLCSQKQLKSIQLNCHKFDDLFTSTLSMIDEIFPALGHLENITLNLDFPNSKYISSKDFYFKNLFTHTTKIEVYDTMLPASHYIYDNIEAFSKLKTLCCENIKYGKIEQYQAGMDYPLNFRPLFALSTLQILQKIDISFVLNSAESIEGFLENFCLPLSIQIVRLVFQRINWSHLISFNQTEDNPFEQHQQCLSFYKKWNCLKNLKSLALKFENNESTDSPPTIYFVGPLLKNISSLRSFDYANHLLSEPNSTQALDFMYLWESFAHFQQDLETLWVTDNSITFENFVKIEEQPVILKDLLIYGNVCGSHQSFRHLVEIFRNGTSDQKSLIIKELKTQNSEEFTEYFRTLVKKTQNLHIRLYLDAAKVSDSAIVASLKKVVTQENQNSSISLYLANVKSTISNDLKQMQIDLSKNKIFARLQILSPTRQLLYDFKN